MSSDSTADITGVEYYWRPGCPFCMGLERGLNKANIPLNRHNIWDDPKAAEHVRSVADGNETVPTVTIDGVSMVNPSARQVIDLLSEKAPHLIPDAADGGGAMSKIKDRFGR